MNGLKRGLLWGGIGVAVLLLGSLVQTTSVQETSLPETSDYVSSQEPLQEPPAAEQENPTESEAATPGSLEQGEQAAPSASESIPLAEASPATSLGLLSTIPIKGRAPKTGFDREALFGEAWLDVDSNGCDTRNDILARDLDSTSVGGYCRVLSGELSDPFSAEEISFVRGETTSILVQIDHVVSLSNAWQTGAQQLDQWTRIQMANDPLNLIAVSGRLNAQKGDSDAATWLPPNRAFWCEYVARQVGVKAHYGLWMTQSEHNTIASILSGCPDFPALTPDSHGRYRPGAIPMP